MTLPGDNHDAPPGSVTQGGHRDETSPGPARRSGNSFWWFSIALLLAAAIAVFVLTTRSHKDAPAERNTIPVSGETGHSRLGLPGSGAR